MFPINPDDFIHDSDSRAVIVKPHEPNSQRKLQEVVSVLIVDVYNRYKAILDLCNEQITAFDYSCIPLRVFLTLLSNGSELSNMDIMSISKLLNTDSSTVLLVLSYY